MVLTSCGGKGTNEVCRGNKPLVSHFPRQLQLFLDFSALFLEMQSIFLIFVYEGACNIWKLRLEILLQINAESALLAFCKISVLFMSYRKKSITVWRIYDLCEIGRKSFKLYLCNILQNFFAVIILLLVSSLNSNCILEASIPTTAFITERLITTITQRLAGDLVVSPKKFF